VYLSVSLVDTGQVYPGGERELGRKVGVIGTAVNLDAVDAIFVDALQRMLVARGKF